MDGENISQFRPDPGGVGFIDTPALPVAANMPDIKPGQAVLSVGTPEFRAVLDAEIQSNNTVGSIVADESGPTSKFMLQPYDPDFNLKEAIKGTGYENDPQLFVTARNKEHVDAIVNDLWREQQNREITANSTWGQYIPAMIAGQAADPLNWLSFGTIGALKLAGKAATRSAITRGAVIGGGVAAETAVQETILQATQRTRTVEESVAAVGGSLILGGLLGSLGSKLLLQGEQRIIEKVLEADMKVIEADAERLMMSGSGKAISAGAAAVKVGDETVAPTVKGAFGFDVLSSRMGPMQRTMRSDLETTRRAANELAESPYVFKENETGQITAPRGNELQRPGTVQTRIGAVWESRMMPAIYNTRNAYLEYRGVHADTLVERTRLGLNDMMGRRGEALSEVEFRQAVTDALNNGDKHEIPQVAKAAADIRERFLKYVEEDGLASGVLKDGQDAVPRSYLSNKIIAKRSQFRDIVFQHLKARQAEIEKKVAELDREQEALRRQQEVISDDVRADREMRMARDQAERDAARAEPVKYEGLPVSDDEIDGIVGYWKYIREMEAKRKPTSLASFIVRSGGLEDPGGDVLSMIGGYKGRPGLVRKADEAAGGGMFGPSGSSGRSLDDWALRAWENGYFPGKQTRPTIEEFLDKLSDDLQTGKSVPEDDLVYFDDMQAAREMAAEMRDYGIEPGQFRSEASLRRFFGQKPARAAGEGASDAGSAGGRAGEGSGGKADGAAPRLSATEQRLRIRAQETDAELMAHADRVTARLHSMKEGRTAHDADKLMDENGLIQEDALLTKEDFALPYNAVRDFVERDVELLMRMTHRSMIPDIEIALRFGSADMAKEFKAIQDEAVAKMNATTDPKERAKIEKRAREDVRDLASMRDRINGRYALPADPTATAVRAGRFLRDAVTVTKMGGSVLASIPETGRIVAARGIGAVFSDIIYPMVKNFEEFARVSADAKIATHALDHHTSARAMAMADGAEDWGNLPKVDRFSREATKNFMWATGLPKLTDYQKTLAGNLSMKSILEASEAMADGALKSKQLTMLSRLGISKENAAIIAEQFRKHGKKTDNIWAPEVGKWDPEARAAGEALLGGIRMEVGRLITSPGLETPNMAQSEFGKLLFQLKSFSMASYERVLVSGLQHNDVPFWSSVAVQVGLAMAVNEARKAILKPTDGKEKKPFDQRWNDPKERNQMFIDAVDKSGVLGWLSDVNSIMDRQFGAGFGRTLGTGGVNRRGLVTEGQLLEQIAGPGAGTALDTVVFGDRLARAILGQRDMTEADTRRLKSITPFIGLIYLRAGLEALGAEEAFNRQIGARKQ